MDDKHYCIHEKEWGELRVTLDNIQDRLVTHVVEGDKPGGYRDRLLVMEESQKSIKKEIATIKQGYWKACIVSGVIGGLLGNLTPDFFNLLIRLVVK